MKMIDDVVDNLILSRYGDKAYRFDVSPKMIIGRNGDGGISALAMVRSSYTKEEFEKLVDVELEKNRNTDFYHFSLLMGKYFGVYNLYCYMHIVPDVRKKIIQSVPNLSKTVTFFNKYNDNIFSYISDNYDVSEREYNEIIRKIFILRDDYDIYNSPVVRDIAKIIMGNELYQQDNLTSMFINSEDAIKYFDEKNRLTYIKNKK